MEYRKTKCAPCDSANHYWDYRNAMMVHNVAQQMKASGDIRNVIIVGAGHVYGILEYFEKYYPEITVIHYLDIPDNRDNPLPIPDLEKLLLTPTDRLTRMELPLPTMH